MSRPIVLSAVLTSGVLSIAASAWQQPAGGGGGLTATPSVDALQVEKLSDNLFVLRGGGGNTAAFVSSTGVVLVDTKVSGWGQPILAMEPRGHDFAQRCSRSASALLDALDAVYACSA